MGDGGKINYILKKSSQKREKITRDALNLLGYCPLPLGQARIGTILQNCLKLEGVQFISYLYYLGHIVFLRGNSN